MKNNKSSGQKVVAVTYGRWSFMRGSDCRHLTGKSLVLLIGGRLWGGHFPEVVAHEGINCLVVLNFVIHLKSAIEFGLSDYNFYDL